MTLRNASGKFSLPGFGRKTNQQDTAPAQSRVSSSTYSSGPPASTVGGYNSEPSSPRVENGPGGGGGGGGPGGGFGGAVSNVTLASSGVGRKLGKSIAHTSLLPALGNQDLRTLQDLITTEKGAVQATEKLAKEIGDAASKLPPYGQSEGADLQDVLTHSATLLGHLSNAMRSFANHQGAMRVCYKRIREREEQLDELRRRRRVTASKAEAAERKLQKMGPENKQLVGQTELLERLRGEIRQMDSDLVHEESKLGDFKRQSMKEAMSYKFGGLEELGEKMCIIGELGKTLLEEIPLEETPPGYGRAPYTGMSRTESTTREALKCLAGVQFHAASNAPKPPGLPNLGTSGALTPPYPAQGHANHQPTNSMATMTTVSTAPRPIEDTIEEHEEFSDALTGEMSPTPTSPGVNSVLSASSPKPTRISRPPQLPEFESPYGGLSLEEEAKANYPEVKATYPEAERTYPNADLAWRGQLNNGSRTGSSVGVNTPVPQVTAQTTQYNSNTNNQAYDDDSHDYEYEQQREMDAQAQRELEEAAAAANMLEQDNVPELGESHAGPGWQPLKVQRRSGQYGMTLQDGPAPSLPPGAAQNRGVSLHDGPGYTLPALAPSVQLEESLMPRTEAPAPAELARPPSNNSAYYSADGRGAVPTPTPQFPGGSVHNSPSPPVSANNQAHQAHQAHPNDALSHQQMPMSPTDAVMPDRPGFPPALSPEHETSPARPQPTLAIPTSPREDYSYEEEQHTPVVTIPAERPRGYVPPVAPPASTDLSHDAPISIERESYYGGRPRDSYQTTDSYYTHESSYPSTARQSYQSYGFQSRDNLVRESFGQAPDGRPIARTFDSTMVSIPSDRELKFSPTTGANGTGVISAGAFRRAPRSSTVSSTDGHDTAATNTMPTAGRRLPVPPSQPAAAVPSSPSPRSSMDHHANDVAPPYSPHDSLR